MQTDTATNVVSAAARELGLVSAAIADPYASLDDNVLQLCALLSRAGKMLVRAKAWSHLTKEYTFPTVNATATYALPSDFDRLKDGSVWNRTTTLPLGGPVGSRGWQEMKARAVSGVVIRPFRIAANLINLYPVPTGAETVAFEYVSGWWVVPTGQTAPTTGEPTASTDVLWWDETLIVAALKLSFLRAKQMDYSAAQAEYDDCLAAAASGDGAAPVLNVAGTTGERFLGYSNVPDTGYGA